jgi:hypothetical protein
MRPEEDRSVCEGSLAFVIKPSVRATGDARRESA